MSRLPIFGSALSILAVATVLSGCAGPMAKQSSVRVAGTQKSDVALGLRAQAALSSGDFASAVDLAERAAEKTPQDATVRVILANAYFGAGRFASAESAYRDALSLTSGQSNLVLKLALVLIAQGKSAEANHVLHSAGGALEAADLGLALALAGDPERAVHLLEGAARATGADSRVRQNLALAYGLTGNWDAARTIAAQDLPANLVDSRVQQWMALAKPARPSDQVASLIGISPAAADPGQPVRLALNPGAAQQSVQMAAMTAPVAPMAAPEVPAAMPVMAAMEPAPMPPAETYYPASPEAPVVAEAAPVSSLSRDFAPVPAAVVATAPVAADVVIAAESLSPIMASLAPVVASAPKSVPARAAAAARGDARARFAASASPTNSRVSGVVVQLGAYSSPDRVETAWDQAADRHAVLARYTPTSARFQSAKGVVYRLSVKGFSDSGEAKNLCVALQKQGRSCFVRQAAGDSRLQFASRG